MDNYNQKRIEKKVEYALAKLLMTESFDSITTTKLSKVAEISRSSFYIYFRDKYDVVESFQKRLFTQIEEIFDDYHQAGQKRQAVMKIFTLLEQDELFSALLSENGTKEIKQFLKNKLRFMITQDLSDGRNLIGLQSYFGQREIVNVEKEYSIVFVTDAIFGVLQAWISKGKKEPAADIVNAIIKMLPYQVE